MSNARQPLPFIYRLRCPIKSYAWGQQAGKAFIPQLLVVVQAGMRDWPPNQPAAELWMGAHPSDPAYILAPDADVSAPVQDASPIALDQAILEQSAHFLGYELHQAGLRHLPFLFKVLDAARPLSIQAHPDAELAAQLHQQKPQYYPDPYHKPELAICLKNMRALIGFRPIMELQSLLATVPALAELCAIESSLPHNTKTDNANSNSAWLKTTYSNLMQASALEIERAAQKHKRALGHDPAANAILKPKQDDNLQRQKQQADALFELFVEYYGYQDPGIFCAYFLNYVELAPRQAIFLRPNEPHSYISGIILECMAASDNVVRAGLTKKYCDTATLINMLDYKTAKPQILELQHPTETQTNDASQQGCNQLPNRAFQSYARMDNIADFALYAYNNNTETPESTLLSELQYPSILLVLEGQAELHFFTQDDETDLKHTSVKKLVQREELPRGTVVLLPGDLAERRIEVHLQLTGAQVYRALAAGVP